MICALCISVCSIKEILLDMFLESKSGGSSNYGQQDPEGVTLAQVIAGLTMLGVCYLFAQSEQAKAIPEVSFSYFLQHMLYIGEVFDCGIEIICA